jgi:hypothetical protein
VVWNVVLTPIQRTAEFVVAKAVWGDPGEKQGA